MSVQADIMLILNSHLDYLGRIEDYINQKIPDPLAATYDKCKLGSWYYSVTDPKLKEHPEFVALGDMHKHFHEVTDTAIADYRGGQVEEAKAKLGEAYSLFGQISNKLMALDDAV